jgi:hypothetical protein
MESISVRRRRVARIVGDARRARAAEALPAEAASEEADGFIH